MYPLIWGAAAFMIVTVIILLLAAQNGARLFWVAVFLSIGLTYLTRSVAEHRPDSFWLTASFFALIAEIDLVVRYPSPAQAEVVSLVFVIACGWIVTAVYGIQRDRTTHHLRRVLTSHLEAGASPTALDDWTRAGQQMIGIDFLPELFVWLPGTWNPRDEARRDFVKLLPSVAFTSVQPGELEVPPEERTWLWRGFSWPAALSLWVMSVNLLLVRVGG